MVSVVIPTYNRGTSLEYVCLVLTEYLAENYESYEVILVDDGSGDHTAKVIGQLCQQYKHVKGLVLEANVGQQNATLAGIRITTKPLVVTMDDDLRYGLKGIKALVEKLDEGYKVVYGLHSGSVGSRVRRNGTGFKELFFRLFCGKPSKVKLTSFRVMTKEVVDFVKKDQAVNVYISAAILQTTKSLATIEVQSDGALDLPTNYTFKSLVRIMWQVFCQYSVPGQWLRLRKEGQQYQIKEIHK